MSVYVDPVHNTNYPVDGDWPFTQYSHLFADTIQELKAFAIKIELKHRYLHYSLKYTVPHFDITVQKRDRAIRNGAEILNKKDTLIFLKNYACE